MNENDIIKGCLKNNRENQKALYDYYYGKMYGLCLRYSRNSAEAKEMVHEAFFKVFAELKNHKPNEPLEPWIKNIMIHTSIEFLRRNRENMIVSTVYANKIAPPETKTSEGISDEELILNVDKEIILKAVQELAPAYRKVFNLYTIEGYSHKKIAELLNIGEETSGLTLEKAKFNLRKNIKQLIKKKDDK